MAISPDDRSPKRQRLSSDEESEEEEDYNSPNDAEEEEDEDDDEEEEIEREEEEEQEEQIAEDANGTRMATIGNDSEDVMTEAQSKIPVNSSPSSSSSSPHQSVKLKTSKILDCPTCCEPLKKPIYQCTNGHLACSSCCTKLRKKCPFCRSPIGDIRCRAMEDVIEASIVPCRNALFGCKEITSYGNQSSHKTLCAFVRCSCPLPDCTFMGIYTDLKSHAQTDHAYTYPEDKDILIPFVFDRPLIFYLNLNDKKLVFQEKKEDDLVVVQAFEGSHGVYVTVSSIAPNSPEIRGLSCSLAKLNGYSTLRLGLMVKKVPKVRDQEQPEDDFLLIPSYMLSGRSLKMQICIGKGLKYAQI